MNINRKTLILAIAAGMGLVPLTGVFATPLNLAPGATSGSAKPLYFPAEAKESSTDIHSVYSAAANTAGQTVKAGGDLDVYVYTMPGYAVKVGEQKTLVVKVALTGGAKFNKAPVLVCPHSGILGSVGNPASTRSVTVIGWDQTTAATNVTAKMEGASNAAGTTTGFFLVAINAAASQASYSFAFPDGFVIPKDGSGACILSLTAGEPYPVASVPNSAVPSIKAVAGSSVDMTVEVTYDEFFTKVTKTATVPIISFATAYQATVSLTNEGSSTKTAAGAVIDVGSSSKKFIAGAVPTLQAFVGHVVVTATDTTIPFRTFRDASGNIPLSAGSLIDSATITLAGIPIGNLTKVSFNKANGAPPTCDSTTLVEATPVATTTSGSSVAAGSVLITVTGGATPSASYRQLVSDNGGTPTLDHKGMIVCLVADGTKAMDAGYISMTVNGVSKSGKVVELGVSSDYYEVKRNGTVIRVLNVPMDPADAWKVNIRMFNVSNQELTGIKGSVYAVDGTLIKDGLDLGTIPANSLKLVTSDAVAGMVGSPVKGRAWMLIQAPAAADTFKVQVLMKNPTGELSNLSTDAVD